MPTAPMAQRQVVDAPVPNVRVGATPSPDALGGQIGDTVTSGGIRAYDLLTRSANQTAVFEADRQLADKQTDLETQLYATKGKQALGADSAILKQFDDHVQNIESGLTNDQQRGAFQRTYVTRRQQLNDLAQKHIRTEFGLFQDEETKATIESAKDRTRQNPDVPNIVGSERQRALSALGSWAQRKGLIGEITPEMLKDPQFQQEYKARGQTPPTLEELNGAGVSKNYESRAYQEKRRVVMSGLHKDVIDGLLAKDQDQAAKTYAEQNREHFTAGDLDAVEKSIEAGSTRGDSRRTAAQLIGTHGIATPEQRRDVMKAVDGITNDKVADATRQRLEHEFSVFDQRKEQDYTHRYELASKVMEDRAFKQPRAVLEDLVPQPLLQALKANDREALRVHLDRIRRPAENVHDPKVWFKLEGLTNAQLAKVKPDEMMGTYLNHFDAAHYDRALNNWNAARNMVEKKDDKYVSALSDRERIKNGWINAKIAKDPSKLSDEELIWFNRYETQADQALSHLPKDATPEQKQKIIDGVSDTLLKQRFTVDPGLFRFNKQIPAIGMPDVQDPRSVKIPLEKIPAPEQDTIKGLFKSAGKPHTQDKIERIYALRKLQQTGQLSKEAMMSAAKAIILE